MLWAKKKKLIQIIIYSPCAQDVHIRSSADVLAKYEWQTVKNHLSHMYSVCAAGEDSGGE